MSFNKQVIVKSYSQLGKKLSNLMGEKGGKLKDLLMQKTF